jgi:hypothetical protein
LLTARLTGHSSNTLSLAGRINPHCLSRNLVDHSVEVYSASRRSIQIAHGIQRHAISRLTPSLPPENE